MENINKMVSVIIYSLLALAVIDMMIMVAMILQIASGVDTPHIGFWDAQLSFIARLLAH